MAGVMSRQEGAGAVKHPSAPADLPLMELRRRLAVLHRYYAGLLEWGPDLMWATQADTIRMCQILGGFADSLQEIRIAAELAEQHCRLLFDLSFNEGEKRGVHDRRDP